MIIAIFKSLFSFILKASHDGVNVDSIVNCCINAASNSRVSIFCVIIYHPIRSQFYNGIAMLPFHNNKHLKLLSKDCIIPESVSGVV